MVGVVVFVFAHGVVEKAEQERDERIAAFRLTGDLDAELGDASPVRGAVPRGVRVGGPFFDFGDWGL